MNIPTLDRQCMRLYEDLKHTVCTLFLTSKYFGKICWNLSSIRFSFNHRGSIISKYACSLLQTGTFISWSERRSNNLNCQTHHDSSCCSNKQESARSTYKPQAEHNDTYNEQRSVLIEFSLQSSASSSLHTKIRQSNSKHTNRDIAHCLSSLYISKNKLRNTPLTSTFYNSMFCMGTSAGNLRIEWRPVCVHAIWTRLVTRQIHEAR